MKTIVKIRSTAMNAVLPVQLGPKQVLACQMPSNKYGVK